LPKTAAESMQPSWSGNENASDSVNRDTQDVQSEYSSHPSRSSKKRTARIAVVALIVLAIAAALFIAIQATHKTSSSSSDDTASSQSAVSATSLQSEEGATGESGAHSSSVKDDIAEDAPESLAQDMQNDKTPKNGFDERTNFIDSVAGVDFQIPSYFKASVIEDEKDSTYYYAERGYSVAMVHLRASKMDSDTTREDFEHFKDDYLKGFMDSSGFDQVLSYSDCELAGYAARIATLKGSLNDLPITIKLAYFFNPELQTVGSITLGQSSNVQFDYAIDFAKVITSATSPSQGNLEPQPLELVDSAYTASNGYLHYVVEIKNPNDGYCAEFATISVVGRSADGGIAFSHDWVVGGIAPGTVTYWPDICGKGEVAGDEEITIEVSVDKINWKRTAGSSSGNPYRFDNVSAKREEYTGLTVTGVITLMEEVEAKKLTNVKVSQTGCIGLCKFEPIVEVFVPGQEKATYVNVDPNKAREIIQSHILNGKPVVEYMYSDK